MDADLSQVRALSVGMMKDAAALLPLARVVVQKACADTKRDAQALAPVDTGNLRSSIGYETRALKAGAVGEVGPTANYGQFVEDGTSVMSPQPYMGPASDRNIPLYIAACEALAAKVSK